jgi:hypothetical protein
LVLRAKLPQYWLSSLQNPEISGLIAIIDPANLASKDPDEKSFITREFRGFDGLPGDIRQRTMSKQACI